MAADSPRPQEIHLPAPPGEAAGLPVQPTGHYADRGEPRSPGIPGSAESDHDAHAAQPVKTEEPEKGDTAMQREPEGTSQETNENIERDDIAPAEKSATTEKPRPPDFGSEDIKLEEVKPGTATTAVHTNEAKTMQVPAGRQGEIFTQGNLHGCTAVGGFSLGTERTISVSHISPGTEHAGNPPDDDKSQSVEFIRLFGEMASGDRELQEAQLVVATREDEPGSTRPGRVEFVSQITSAVADLNRIPGVLARHITYPYTDDGFSLGVALLHDGPHIVRDTSEYKTQLGLPTPSDRIEYVEN
jgi:hypothetical protein